jgi:hypothetical protein
MEARRAALLAAAVGVALLAACAQKTDPVEPAAWSPSPAESASEPTPGPAPSGAAAFGRAPSPTPGRTAKPTTKPRTVKKTVSAGADVPTTGTSPTPTGDGVPVSGAGTFSTAAGGTDVIGTGTALVAYRVEVEDGISWGSIQPWTPASFAAKVDGILAAPQSWIASGEHPVTDPAEGMTGASWSFRRVSGSDYSVRIRLATPDTVDRLCGAVGLDTQGQYSCRYGKTLMINLRRWLKGAAGFPIDVAGYRHMVINHEMGHFLGFNHMKCPGSGKLAPVMQTQTVALNGCVPNAYPFDEAGTFVVGPWAPS